MLEFQTIRAQKQSNTYDFIDMPLHVITDCILHSV